MATTDVPGQHGGAADDRALWTGMVRAVAVHPSLWATAVAQAVRLARRGWWRQAPFLPLPDPDYVRFRLETQYGREGRPEAADVVAYLRWCRAERR